MGVAASWDIIGHPKQSYQAQERIMEANRAYFRDLVTMYKDDWVHEYRYWQRMGKG
jgi:hypothetical protein